MEPDARLPTFIVIGAYKCGTTALYHYLRQHPEIFMPSGKELLYWSYVGNPDCDRPSSARSVHSLDAYLKYFEPAGDLSARGEVSPEYLVQARTTAPEIRRGIPDVKLIALLRDPVERAWSDYLMYRLNGRETKSFEAALGEQAERQRRADPTGYYLETGYYGRQLEPYYDLFPVENILVVLQEDLRRSTLSTMQRIYGFVGVADTFKPEIEHHKAALFPRGRAAKWLARIGGKFGMDVSSLYHKPEIPPSTARRLQETYAEDVARIAALSGVDLNPWKWSGPAASARSACG